MNKKRKTLPAAELSGQYLVFTGKLTITRKEATAFVKKMGCCVQSSVTRKTTLLVLGSQDKKRLRQGHRRSLKHDAVKKRIKEGQAITILQQEEFYILIHCPIQRSLLNLVAHPIPKKRRTSPKKKEVEVLSARKKTCATIVSVEKSQYPKTI
ncbi:BRCA1 C Terminus (BRCT) domain-containing protein [Candidatus Electrothrix aarhusensis]|jgi:DNA polymerase-3 subunit epsilon|uniref:BRCA1 C Terminus (BRCT) domain-containing protein n=1 Tax=Candidatus Electrothrix aarhusensis TaxID=1859131 RepID=A0A3S3QGK7_9BACT|nr:BRCA1 C Terminus (BRCT) domain-containing protein [Candidatus Electrothrix aarhusensis]